MSTNSSPGVDPEEDRKSWDIVLSCNFKQNCLSMVTKSQNLNSCDSLFFALPEINDNQLLLNANQAFKMWAQPKQAFL